MVVAHSDGSEKWRQEIGAVGYNFGKYGTELADGTVLIAGAQSFVDNSLSSGYYEAATFIRLDQNSGTILSTTALRTLPQLALNILEAIVEFS